jgi:hypothetical protein
VRLRRLSILTRLKTLEPPIRFLGRDVQGGRLIVSPSGECIVAQALARLFAFNILLDRLPHEPMRRATAGTGQTLQTVLGLHVLAYNFTRVMNIIGVRPLIAALNA